MNSSGPRILLCQTTDVTGSSMSRAITTDQHYGDENSLDKLVTFHKEILVKSDDV